MSRCDRHFDANVDLNNNLMWFLSSQRLASRCLQYMSDFNSCLLQNFGVLAGPPSRVKALLVSTTYAIISWQPPKILPDTVTEYHVYLRKLGSGSDYTVVEKDHQPIIVEDLEPATRYEVFVVSMNAHGKGGPSPRLVLQTKHEVKLRFNLLLISFSTMQANDESDRFT